MSANPFSRQNYYKEGGAGASAAPTMQGMVHKKATTNQLLWRSSYMVLDSAAKVLVCFKSEAGSKSGRTSGKIPIGKVVPWAGKPNGFQVTTPLNRVYNIYTDSADLCERWIQAIEGAIAGAGEAAVAEPAPEAPRGTVPTRASILPTGASALVGSDGAAAFVVPMRRSVASAAEAGVAPGAGASADTAALQKEAEELRKEVATLKAQLAVANEAADAAESSESADLPTPLPVSSTGVSVPAAPPSAASAPALRRHRGSILPDGTMVDVSPAEMRVMHSIFELFDESKTGSIKAKDLVRLHNKLGEPLSEEEAVDAIQFISTATSGAVATDDVEASIDFHVFVKWWNFEHRPDEKGSRKGERYAGKFKFIKARVANPELGHIITRGVGDFPSFEYRVQYFTSQVDAATGEEQLNQISPWHDVPLHNPDGSYNFVCEIPKWTRRKMEIATGEGFNPIKQDTKNGKLREYKWGDMMFNYGAMPQTWEDPAHITEPLGTIGDNDPIDVVEIGIKQWPMGAIVQVKVLGVLALIDEGETDWKVICISMQDPLAAVLNDVADVEAHIPGCITAIHDWLRDYKAPTINEYGFDGQCLNRAFAEAAVEETHEFWKQLVAKKGGDAVV
jgi:inorganic pyrophosphatase